MVFSVLYRVGQKPDQAERKTYWFQTPDHAMVLLLARHGCGLLPPPFYKRTGIKTSALSNKRQQPDNLCAASNVWTVGKRTPGCALTMDGARIRASNGDRWPTWAGPPPAGTTAATFWAAERIK
ncbi:hypothetical protein MAPG_10906 [Magnaporthiopsis poae ATCC 64411]|uniref:Uncharacterized protein n=1 Tax=Magnaporthiopsis poae (strain ATCC 64411 / 73-15) TaxID=644358 RepID=A0A0C4EDU6_MAGP6|nr:hypothetical protein MAPG_10906 [Magnaporthiopsis poae ATCC 64411]